ncbi:DUF3943 domain-containing protein [Flavobacterium sp. M31R6]|uniref:DUF3943 domain-containing protein n=1 Tax=Flavobacterium sp. M31R6 TaxID=2739062 RepID=UPI0015693E4F|nr:DUF3943 domain-containing protein [Flavobacterium sp. M31R6]QKJ63938.1 DUF3943 domain-containing protein [Flavobacterium sp. M31R6]
MNPFKTNLYAFIILLSGNAIFAQQAEQSINNQNQLLPSLSQNTIAYSESQKDSSENVAPYNYNMLSLVDSTLVQPNITTYPPATRDYRRLGYNTAMYFGASIVAFGILYAMPESVTNWDKQAMKENGITYKWKQNVKAGPVWDHDDWVLNYVTHPYAGGIYYMTARSSGFNIFESFLYSAFMSTCFWEYGIEAFAEIPSKQDLVVTPVLGSVVGEGFFYAKKSIFKHDKKVLKSKVLGYTCLALIDPFNTLLDGFGYKEKTKAQLNLAPVGFDKGSNKAIWGLNFNMQF